MSVTGGQPLFSTKRVRKALRLAEIAVNDLQSNFLKLYMNSMYICVYIYIRLSTYNITFCMAMCQAEKGYW